MYHISESCSILLYSVGAKCDLAKLAVLIFTEVLSHRLSFQLADVQLLVSCSILWRLSGPDVEVEFEEDESVVSPAICTAHGLCHSDILPVPSPDDDVINKMSVFTEWVHPLRLVTVGQVEDGVGGQKVVGCTGLQEKITIAVALTDTLIN